MTHRAQQGMLYLSHFRTFSGWNTGTGCIKCESSKKAHLGRPGNPGQHEYTSSGEHCRRNKMLFSQIFVRTWLLSPAKSFVLTFIHLRLLLTLTFVFRCVQLPGCWNVAPYVSTNTQFCEQISHTEQTGSPLCWVWLWFSSSEYKDIQSNPIGIHWSMAPQERPLVTFQGMSSGNNIWVLTFKVSNKRIVHKKQLQLFVITSRIRTSSRSGTDAAW